MLECVEIIPDLWIGNLESAANYQFQELYNINCMINCIKDLNFWGKSKEYNELIKNNIERYEIDKMYNYLMEVTEFIYHNLKNNKVILVYCEDGIQKSPTIVAAYMIRYGNMDIPNSVQAIKSKFNKAFLNHIDFLYALEKFFKNIATNKSLSIKLS